MASFVARALALPLALTLSACGPTATVLKPDAGAPFVKGEVVASYEDDGNGEVTVSVEHLGDPSRLTAGATTYVVWVVPQKDGAQPQNMGALVVDASYSGKLSFKTTFRPFDISVTPEASAAAVKPEGRAVLSGRVSQ
ncbi:MAG: hypothetical protein IPM79_34445 [Polyangiaceae bacterium]|nr:hypothetical protein [Polyangiaceae bacterium]MBK8942560.1 hypothetical protein [Polyangiaceae bacterium]